MGPAIAGMHYTGMASMRMPADVSYSHGAWSCCRSSSPLSPPSRPSSSRATSAAHVAHGAVLKVGAARAHGGGRVRHALHGHAGGALRRDTRSADGQSGVIATRELGWAIAIGADRHHALALLAGVRRPAARARRTAALEASRQRASVVETLQHIGQSLTSELDLQRDRAGGDRRGHGADRRAVRRVLLQPRERRRRGVHAVHDLRRAARGVLALPDAAQHAGLRARPSTARARCAATTSRRIRATGTSAPYHGMPAGHLPVRSYLAVPVISRTGDVLGGSVLRSRGRRACSRSTTSSWPRGSPSWAAVAMDNAQLFEARAARARGGGAGQPREERLPRGDEPRAAHAAQRHHRLRGPPAARRRQRTRRCRQVKLERIGLSAQHLLALIDEILTFSRLEAGEEHVDVEPGRGQSAAARGAGADRAARAREGHRVPSAGCPARRLAIESDDRKIRQILLNLVTNAVKFTERGLGGDHARAGGTTRSGSS